jgi:O-antigen ligase
MAYVALWRGQEGGLQLNSVGHVNHTAIYLAIMLGVAAAWLFSAWRRWPGGVRVLAIAITILILAALISTASRGAIGIGFVMLLVVAAAWWPRSRAPLQVAAGVLVITLLVMMVGGAEVLRKQEANARSDNVLAYRSEIWSIAIATWREHPWFGVGMGNFGASAKKRRPASVADADYERMKDFNFPHAHSLFLNTLAERGLLGAGALGAFLLALFVALFRHRPAAAGDDDAWLLWGGASAAWLVTLGVGLVNTTLHNEHGILAALLLGLWLSKRPGR